MKLNPFVMMREELEGTGIVFDPENNLAMTLNKTGVLIWNALAAGGDRDAAVKSILEKYNVSEEKATADVDAFLDLLREKNLLEDA